MNCSGCKKKLETGKDNIYQIRLGHIEPHLEYDDFEPREDIGHYCSPCFRSYCVPVN